MIVIEMENGKTMEIELDYKAAPISAANFEKLVRDGFYDGLTFHRVIPGFVIQGGDPLGNGMGGSEETIKGEFLSNGYDNPLKHERGVLSMARAQDPDSASSQFFICHADVPYLDGGYAAFGRVVSGLETLDEIANCETGFMDRPVKKQVMKRVYIK